MKFYELKAVAEYIGSFRQIKSAGRVADNVIRLEFEKGAALGFDLSRGRAEIFAAGGTVAQRRYHAPFDTILKKRFAGAEIVGVGLVGNDKILKIDTAQRGAYKASRTTLWLEFTGRHTNAIILDGDGVVLEALRHVDSEASFRVVQPGVKLLPLKPYEGERQQGEIEDVEAYLAERAERRRERRLKELKRRHAGSLRKKIERLEKELRKLPQRDELEKRAAALSDYGSIVLAHLHEIRPYDKLLETVDFQGNPVTIELPPLPNPKRMGEHFYSLSKRAANKAERLHIEQKNLKSRIEFYKRMLQNLEEAEDEERIALLFPPKQRHRKKEQRFQCETFEVDGYRVLVGRNERENIWVLKNARAGDIWLHLKERPSSHCIVQTGGKKQIPRDVIKKAARICVETSTSQPGDYLVDFTHRRNVKIDKGAHVTYTKYDTIKIRKA
ncbi:fibronectin/fibrinogen-binding protein [Hydrogenimonas sp.]|nr:fibronectin/fibrinogen-binding protein [Hydrogenimonas sp.]